jgi:pimeloyl-ACP methyl ester carboxylesterase
MSSPAPLPLAQDHHIPHPRAQLFARSWQPEGGDGAAPIVMQHDSLGCTPLWRDFPARLAQATGRRVIAYDRWGFGQSDARPDRPTVAFVAEEPRLYLPAVLDALGVDAFVALGHSVGGGMSIETAAFMPTRCEALVTIAAQVFAEDRTLNGIRAAREQFQDPQQLERLARYHGGKARWVLDAWTETWLSTPFADWTLLDVLPQVKCPALAIHGELDEYGSTRHPTLIGERCGGPTRVEILAATGHVPQREDPARVAALIADFLGQAAA